MKIYTPILAPIATFIFPLIVNAQVPPTIQWQRSLGGSDYDYANCVIQTFDGAFVIAGYTLSTNGDVTLNNGEEDCWIVKLDEAGNILWQKSYGGTSDDEASFIRQTSDGGFIVAGFTFSNDFDVSGNHGGYDYWIFKLDENGNLIWQKCLGGNSFDQAFEIEEIDGGFIVAGCSKSHDGDVTGNHDNSTDFWVARLDTAANIIWERALGGDEYDQATSVKQTKDGGFVVTGWSQSLGGDVTGNHGFYDFWTVKLDSAGNLLWETSHGGTGYDQPWCIQQTADGGFISTGFTVSDDYEVSGNHGDSDGWILKMDSVGNLEWQRCLGGTAYDRMYSIQQTPDHGYIVAGIAYSIDGDVSGVHGSGDYWVVKLDSSGNLIWQKPLGGSLYDRAFSIQQTDDSGFIVAGWTASSDGDLTNNHGAFDYWIVKLSSDFPTIVQPIDTFATIITISPNPVHDELNISLECQSADLRHECNEAFIRVFDLQGRECISIPFKLMNNQLHINTQFLMDGFYTVQISMNNGNKMVARFVKQ